MARKAYQDFCIIAASMSWSARLRSTLTSTSTDNTEVAGSVDEDASPKELAGGRGCNRQQDWQSLKHECVAMHVR